MEDADAVQARLALSRRQEMAGFSTIVLLAVDNSEPSEYAFNCKYYKVTITITSTIVGSDTVIILPTLITAVTTK